jgi:hypothetical protein
MQGSAQALDTGSPVALGHRFLGKLRRAVGRAAKRIAGRFGIGQPRT